MNKHNKFKSLTTWFAIWAAVMITIIVFTGKTEFLQLTLALAALPLSYAVKSTVVNHDLAGKENQ